MDRESVARTGGLKETERKPHVRYWPLATLVFALHMSAFGGKADMIVCGSPLSWSLLGVKRTWPVALHESADDPKADIATRWNLQGLMTR